MSTPIIRMDVIPPFIHKAHKILKAQGAKKAATTPTPTATRPSQMPFRTAEKQMKLVAHGHGIYENEKDKTIWYREGDVLKLNSDFDKERLINSYLDDCRKAEGRKVVAQVPPQEGAQPSKVNKKIQLELVGLDGNAFSLMGAFQRQARREKWAPAEIKVVLDECMSGDYNHLLATLMNYCESPEGGQDEDDSKFEDLGDDDEPDDDRHARPGGRYSLKTTAQHASDEEPEQDLGTDACPGCECVPGEGVSANCNDPDGCGYWKDLEKQYKRTITKKE